MGVREAFAKLAVPPAPRVEITGGTAKTQVLRSNSPGSPSSPVGGSRKEQEPKAHPCSGCKRFAFPEPGVLCYWCRRSRDQAPLGPPCDGCGEACERCLGQQLEASAMVMSRWTALVDLLAEGYGRGSQAPIGYQTWQEFVLAEVLTPTALKLPDEFSFEEYRDFMTALFEFKEAIEAQAA